MQITPLVFYLLSWILAITMSMLCEVVFAVELLQFIFLFSVGIQGVWAFIGHYFYSSRVPAHIGWTKNAFQKEVAFANLSYGVLGVLSFWFSALWLATIIGYTVFLLGAAWVHACDMVKRKNFAPGNDGIIFYLDLIIPLTLWILFLSIT